MTTPRPLPGPMPPDPGPTLPPKLAHLLTEDEFAAVIHTVRDNNPGMADDLARRIAVEGLKFVVTCATNRAAAIAPSRVVDEGWHALVLHTALYERLCTTLGGIVHHYPERPDPGRFDAEIIDRTVRLMDESGWPADLSLWLAPTDDLVTVAANCQHSPSCSPIVLIPKPKPSGIS
jgi:hypothetical protein